jgi:FkbM family methyltransferase
MNHREELLEKLSEVQRLAEGPKILRFLAAPLRYGLAMAYRYLLYPLTHRGLSIRARTFFGANMRLHLPAGTDIYLCRGKTHDSEIRLARLLLRALRPGDQLLDIGAHVGYFSLLAWHCVQPEGRVVAVEATPSTFSLLQHNTGASGVVSLHLALTNAQGIVQINEYPLLYSEFNTLSAEQYEGEQWHARVKAKSWDVSGMPGDMLLREQNLQPKWIKIDVEGAEALVVEGLQHYLRECQPTVIMEFASSEHSQRAHVEAERQLLALGYQAHTIQASGELRLLEQPTPHYLRHLHTESDNIVYRVLK